MSDFAFTGPAAARAAAPCQQVPARLGEWELVRPLATGQLATIHLARPAGSQQPPEYVAKLLREPWLDDARALEALCREARVGRTVSHPHLVPVLAAELHQAPFYLVMPRLRGQTVESLLASPQRPALPAALAIVRQAAQAIEALDLHGWVHGDVKPENLLVSPAGHATLVDLGFARRTSEPARLGARPVLGTLAYAAPELLSATAPVCARSDVFSLGIVLYELLTGRRRVPEHAATSGTMRRRLAQPLAPRAAEPHLPVGVSRLLRRMLAREPLRRPDPGELVERLVEMEILCFAERQWDALFPADEAA
jgi:serine/threonine-protein kinase